MDGAGRTRRRLGDHGGARAGVQGRWPHRRGHPDRPRGPVLLTVSVGASGSGVPLLGRSDPPTEIRTINLTGGTMAMTRSHRRRAPLALLVCTLLLSVFDVPTVKAQDPLDPVLGNFGPTYPDLVPDVKFVMASRGFSFDEASQTFVPDPTTPPIFSFDTHSQNLGTVALELTMDTPENPAASTVSQCVSWRTDRLCRERA